MQIANLGFLPDCAIQHGAPPISWEEKEDSEEAHEGAADELEAGEGAGEDEIDDWEADEREVVEGETVVREAVQEEVEEGGEEEVAAEKAKEVQNRHNCLTNGKCGSFEFWQAITDHYDSVTRTIVSHPPAGGPVAKLDFSPLGIYVRYMTWRNGEIAMKAHVKNGTAPHLDLHLLPNLQNLEAVGLKEMRVVRRSCRNGPPGHTRSETRRFFEMGLIEANALYGVRYATLTHLPTFMIAASACGKALTCLTVHRVDELFKGQEHDHSNPAIALPNLRSLKIDLRNVWYDYSSMTDPAALAPWMHNLQNLKEMHISQNPGAAYSHADVLSLFRELQFPELTTVTLSDGVLEFRVLAAFLSKYQDTLSLVEINEPFMEKERWEEIHMRYRPGSRFAEGKTVCLSEKVGDDDDG